MILIADCGSTKIDWCVLDKDLVVARVATCGMNAMLLTEDEMASNIARELMPSISAYPIDEVYYYGAGCLGDVCDNVRRAIARNIDAKVIEVASDLLAAARALCADQPGIACIMGTGSNSCYYDGKEIVDNVSPLGYILGDEGSALYWVSFWWVMCSRNSFQSRCARSSSPNLASIALQSSSECIRNRLPTVSSPLCRRSLSRTSRSHLFIVSCSMLSRHSS